MTKIALCPECGNKIIIPDDAEIGQLITCVDQFNQENGCFSEFEIISIEPLQIIPVEEEK